MSKNLSKGYQSSVYFRSHCEQERCISTLDSNFQTWTEKSNILGIMPGEDLMGLKHCFSPSNKVLGALIQCAVAHLIFPTLNLLYCIWPNRRMGCAHNYFSTSVPIASVRLAGRSLCGNVFHSGAYWLNLELRTSQSSERGNVYIFVSLCLACACVVLV